MREVVMNVTRDEFRDIWETWNDPLMSEEQKVRHMERCYGCQRYTNYRVVVQREAPCVPMISWGLKRFSEYKA